MARPKIDAAKRICPENPLARALGTFFVGAAVAQLF
jgi:hypothetical protein